MSTEQKQYQKDYKEFIDAYNSGTTNGENIGEVIARMAQHFADCNLEYASALIRFSNKAAAIEDGEDENGKVLSSAKAKVMSAATEEAAGLTRAKAHLENVETIINALKALQRGILNEYSHMSKM